LFALLPIQLSWAAVAAYCGHESDTQAQHLGHHEHQHDDASDAQTAGDPSDKDGLAALDFDCGHCHTSCCGMPALLGALTPLAITSQLATPVEGSLRTLAQSPPERPQWARFA
jgi:hypothetical protein